MEDFVCPRCGNRDPKYIGYKNGFPYCRFCISLRGENAPDYSYSGGEAILSLKYDLSKEQKEISERLIFNFKRGYDTLINAVCGAGKTELVYGVIEYALKRKLSICFAIPRKDVVIELEERIKNAFPNNKIVSVYGGNTTILSGDIVICTTHQLFRYNNYFDLIILDEIDAFPFINNSLLNVMYAKSKKGVAILMSATPSFEILNEFSKDNHEILELNVRFHHKEIPVPKIVIRPSEIKRLYILSFLKKHIKDNKQVFIFAPTIYMAEAIFDFIKSFFKNGNVVHSKKEDRKQIIEDFKKKKYMFLVTTSVLERGVTVKNLQVLVYRADFSLYDTKTLIQISGRVGRKYDASEGEIIFLADSISSSMEEARRTIISKNKYLQNMF
ncbi:MAG TPA: hypothetical protein DDW20_01665 [Firmicutes bacterium]|mgnify:CR=1 FL=1|nr:hypothetical protein [Bacillota bacterium]